MRPSESESKELIHQLEQLHNKGKHQEIVEQLQQLPKAELSYTVTSLYARALNNMSRCEEALVLLESIREQGQEDKLWQFRMGYSLYYIDGREVESIPYIERAIALGDDYPSTYELLLEAKSYLEDDSTESKDDSKEFKFTCKAFAQFSLKMRLQPKHRAQIEDSLNYMLQSKKWGCVSGGGTLLSKEGEPENCNIELDLVEYSETMGKNLVSIAKKLEVAKGSKINYYAADVANSGSEFDTSSPIGRLVGLGLYISKANLPEKEEEGEGIGDIYNALIGALRNNGALIPSYGENANEVGLYFYGEGAFEMLRDKAVQCLKDKSLGAKFRAIQIG